MSGEDCTRYDPSAAVIKFASAAVIKFAVDVKCQANLLTSEKMFYDRCEYCLLSEHCIVGWFDNVPRFREKIAARLEESCGRSVKIE